MECACCRNFQPSAFKDRPNKLSGSELLRTTQAGCIYCRLLTLVLDTFETGWRRDSVYFEFYARTGHPLQLSYLSLERSRVVLLGHASSGDTLTGVGSLQPLSCFSGDDLAIKFILRRLRECRTHHLCKIAQIQNLPTRLVDVGLSDKDVRLSEVNHESSQYTALSYVWGPPEKLFKTTTQNLAHMKLSVPTHKLPATIKDAIQLTRRLGFRYIWIDSLCILQDDDNDWNSETAMMAAYYSNAELTIGATQASDASCGLFHSREKDAISDVRAFEFVDQSHSAHSLLAQSYGFSYGVPDLFRMYLNPNLGELGKRGWTYQEYLLSRRYVHFTTAQLIWECKTELVHENESYSGLSRGLLANLEEDRVSCAAWMEIIADYSQRSFTFAKDRLPALAGLAALYQSRNGDTYAAGMWRKDLIDQLLWVGHGRSVPGMPSWSWASIDGMVTYPYANVRAYKLRRISHLDEMQMVVHHYNPFGCVRSGLLQITGPLIQLALLPVNTLEPGWDLSRKYTLWYHGSKLLSFEADAELGPAKIFDAAGNLLWTTKRASEPSGPMTATVWCLWTHRSNHSDPDLMRLLGIVLAPSQTFSEDGAYERVGFAQGSIEELLDQAIIRQVLIR